jgi:predicted DNA-binding transcriptional regulator YafY
MGKIGNTLKTLRILETGRKYSVNQLSEILEVSPRMIKRYKEELEKAGIYIESIKGIYGGYVYKKTNSYDVSFSIKDVNAIEKTLTYLDGNIKYNVEILLDKIRTIVIYANSTEQNDDK